jgi:site-specific recombinase XerD
VPIEGGMSVMSNLIPAESKVLAPSIADSKLSPSSLYIMSLKSANSRRTMTSALNNIARIYGGNSHQDFSWLSLKPAHIDLLIEILSKERALRPSTINRHLCALRGVFKAAYKNDEISVETLAKLSQMPSFKSTRIIDRERLDKATIQKLIETCSNDAKGIRDEAIIRIMASCGLRRDEVVGLKISDYDRTQRIAKVLGKGDKERVCNIPPRTAQALNKWIDNFRGENEGFIFCRIRRWSYIGEGYTTKMTGQAIYDMLAKRSKLVEGIVIKPHALRRFCGTSLLKDGNDIVLVRDVLGHADIKTTQLYIENTSEELSNAVARIEL